MQLAVRFLGLGHVYHGQCILWRAALPQQLPYATCINIPMLVSSQKGALCQPARQKMTGAMRTSVNAVRLHALQQLFKRGMLFPQRRNLRVVHADRLFELVQHK